MATVPLVGPIKINGKECKESPGSYIQEPNKPMTPTPIQETEPPSEPRKRQKIDLVAYYRELHPGCTDEEAQAFERKERLPRAAV